MMTNERAEELANKLFEKTITAEEEMQLHAWYSENLYKQVNIPVDFAASKEMHYKRVLGTINKNIGIRPAVKLWPRIAVAAAAVIAVVLGVWLFFATRHPEGSEATRDLYANNIKPGSNKATLTLANGNVITLSEAKSGVVVGNDLRYNDNSAVISSTARDLLNSKDKRSLGALEMTLSTPRGGTYQITLSDGTKVWLNAASRLTYTNGLNKDGVRRVKLTGEGYFEVAKLTSLRGRPGASRGKVSNGRVPFIVETRGQTVEVLGTHFNINSYADEGSVKTTLLEGSVQVNGTTLKPNQQAINTGNAIKVIEVDGQYSVAWKHGYFMFNDEPLESILQKVSRWYNVEIIYDDPVVKKLKFFGTVGRFTNVSKVLEKLELTGKVDFEIKERQIKVFKKNP